MKKLNEVLFITETPDNDKTRWYLSFKKPEFQGGETEEISEEQAYALINIISNN